MRTTAQAVWLGEALDEVPSDEAAVSLARRARETVLGAAQWSAGPIDPAGLCASGPFRLTQRRIGAVDGGAEALLVPRGDHFDVVVDTEPRCGWRSVPRDARSSLERHRLRFRVAHECAHGLFFERTPDGLRRKAPDSDAQEAFCDLFAQALLVPREVALATPPTGDGVVALQRRFDVSMEVAARSLAAAHPAMSLWLMVERPGTEPAWRLQWRSEASYSSGLVARELLRALAGGHPEVVVTTLRDRRQAIAVHCAAEE